VALAVTCWTTGEQAIAAGLYALIHMFGPSAASPKSSPPSDLSRGTPPAPPASQ
jgi:hypothetical protein